VQNKLSEGLLEIQKKVENGQRRVIGVNCHTIPPEEDYQPEIYVPDSLEVEEYLTEYKEFKQKRDMKRLKEALENLRHATEMTDDNLVPYVFEALEANATFPEIIGVLRMVDGMDYDWAGEREYPF
ncbi:MAG: methylmalonyl-CoA mutase family protein, partial [Thermodesulfobacteriota bacterium]|nr:methylmalonyl-CoA mutase family protein [Thermodesulfobacteriota bacterium]